MPGAFHFARFVSQNSYFVTVGLIGHQMVDRGLLDQASVDKAERLLPYIALHDTPAFLMSPLAPGAAYRDLEFIHGIREFRQEDRPIADRVLHSLKGQSWYLDQPWLVTALLGRNVPVEEKCKVAMALHATPRPATYPPYCVTPMLPKQPVHSEGFWPEDGSLPSLSSMVGPRTWQLFDILGLYGDHVKWLELPHDSWEESDGYRRFEDFVERLEVVNDQGERGVKLIQV